MPDVPLAGRDARTDVARVGIGAGVRRGQSSVHELMHESEIFGHYRGVLPEGLLGGDWLVAQEAASSPDG